jgi:MoaA/NifB/PqqE/SkfB family radical SAM enzyme
MTDTCRNTLLAREGVATRPRHWVSLGTACNNRCRFCLDGDRDRGLLFPESELRTEIERGRREIGAEKLILSGGEASIHPAFLDLVRYGKASGYAWVQTITNGLRFADATFLTDCLDAGLDEITFSVHGHTAQLHDELTGHPGAFRQLVRAIALAVRDARPVISVDILLCRRNIEVLDRVVELCIGLGVREFDLLNIIPQGRAFAHREELLYEPAEHLHGIHRVLRLGRHPDYTLWTNRLPARYLEGFEDLIQDPHKLHDEVRGRAQEFRAFLDEGTPLPCRQPERCPHCFMEPFCAFLDSLIAEMREETAEVFSIGAADLRNASLPGSLPFGCHELALTIGDEVETLAAIELPRDMRLRLTVAAGTDPSRFAALNNPLTAIVHSAADLVSWFDWLNSSGAARLEITLNRATAAWLLENRHAVGAILPQLVVNVPGQSNLRSAIEAGPDDPASLFRALALPVGVRGLPLCLAPGAVVVPRLHSIEIDLFDPGTGRLALHPLTDAFIREGYRTRSLRCITCTLTQECAGLQINLVRALGLGRLVPIAAVGEPSSSFVGDPRRWGPAQSPEPAPQLPEVWRTWTLLRSDGHETVCRRAPRDNSAVEAG